jgi:GAF domain-containing protein
MVLVLSASGAGVSVMAENGGWGVAAASDPASEQIEELQFVLGEGPCVNAFVSRCPVLVPDLIGAEMRRWPAYAAAAYDDGVRAVFAFPLQIGAARLGVLDVLRSRPGPLSAVELCQALAFTDLAVTILLDGRDHARIGAAADGSEQAVGHGAELFQAQGMVMVQLGISLVDALSRIRAYAVAEDRRPKEVARDIVARGLRIDTAQP